MSTTDVKFPEKHDMTTLSKCLDSLKSLGYETQFQATEQGLLSLKTQRIFHPDEVKIAHYYRYEGESDPSDNAIIYAIETANGERGTLVDAFGPYNDSQVTNFLQQVEEIHK